MPWLLSAHAMDASQRPPLYSPTDSPSLSSFTLADVRAEDTILRHWSHLRTVTLRGTNMLSLRPTRSHAFYSSAEFFLVPASPYPAGPTLNLNVFNHHYHQQGLVGNAFQIHPIPLVFPHQPHQPQAATHPRRGVHQPKPLTIIFDLRPEFLPPHLTIPSPLTCSWFMRFLRAREADGVCDVPGVRAGGMVVRVADEETRSWVERGRCHLKGLDGGEWGTVVVGEAEKMDL